MRRRTATLRFRPDGKRRRSKSLVAARPFLFAAILTAIGLGLEPALVEPPELLSSKPERVAERFTRCGRGRSDACVVDGDTFRLGERRVRIIGIDAPETRRARCPEEARLGEQATAGLQALLNQGAFEMVAPLYGSEDRYGRELRVVRRRQADGSVRSIAEEMRDAGFARRYLGLKADWC